MSCFYSCDKPDFQVSRFPSNILATKKARERHSPGEMKPVGDLRSTFASTSTLAERKRSARGAAAAADAAGDVPPGGHGGAQLRQRGCRGAVG